MANETSSSAPIPIERAHQRIKTLRAKHKQIMRYQSAGFTNLRIAELVGMSPQAISIITNSDVYKVEMRNFQADLDGRAAEKIVDIKSKIEELAQTSIHELERILGDRTANQAKLRADVAFDILDRAGHRAPAQVEHQHSHIVGFVEDLKAAHSLRKTQKALDEAEALEITDQSEPVVDVQSVEITDKPEDDEE